ncbi:MAG: GNAT family N-acetyltransferase [Firmicutes bacterium]|nr:GNAT family N-acetyltransferase [Bacillota bacterium]
MFRKACLKDIDRISEIYDEIHTEEEVGRTSIGWIRNVYPTRKTAEDSIHVEEMFVEEIDGQIVAAAKINQEQVPEYALATWNYPASDEQIMVLHTLVVSPSVKGSGYGTEFVKFYESYAREQGCPYLRMDTNEKNMAARALYKKLGYTEVSIVPCEFNGIEGVRLVCLEKRLTKTGD